jgi:hypothetical protein
MVRAASHRIPLKYNVPQVRNGAWMTRRGASCRPAATRIQAVADADSSFKLNEIQ